MQPSIGRLSRRIAGAMEYDTGELIEPGASEDMSHAPIDLLIRIPLYSFHVALLQMLPISIDRNKTDRYVLITFFLFNFPSMKSY